MSDDGGLDATTPDSRAARSRSAGRNGGTS